MVFIATFNNISVISRQSVLLVEKTTDLTTLGLAISVNRVNLWRKCKGGLGPANLENDIV
jgi:hypothetical protein